MADKKISALTAAATPLAGTEVLPIVQSGATVKVSVADLTAGRSTQVDTLQVNGAQSATGEIAVKNPSASGQNKLLGFEGATNTQIIGKITYDQNDDALRIINTSNFAGTSLILGTNDSDDVKIDLSGNLSALTGNIVIGTAGKGIDFSANTHAAGMTSELLNDYEEGTWTPTGGTIGATGSSGTYTKVGRQVTVNAIFTGTMSFGAGAVICSNLPFSALAGSDFSANIIDAASTQGAFVRANSTFIISCSAIAVPVSTLAATITYFV